jgi:hypothetical protein
MKRFLAGLILAFVAASAYAQWPGYTQRPPSAGGSGSGDVSAGSAFGTDNRLIRSDGTDKGVQSTGITVDDSDNVTGVVGLTGSGTISGFTNLAPAGTLTSGRACTYDGTNIVCTNPLPVYAMQFGTTNNASVLDATTYYSGSSYSALQTTATLNRMSVPIAGTVVSVCVDVAVAGTLASNEQSTVSFRLNNTTDTAVSAVVIATAVAQAFCNHALSITVAQGDTFEMKWVTPTWATNPTNLLFKGTVVIRPTS